MMSHQLLVSSVAACKSRAGELHQASPVVRMAQRMGGEEIPATCANEACGLLETLASLVSSKPRPEPRCIFEA